jgi:hypothetical protein
MKPEQLVTALEAALRQLGVPVRRERGPFRGGHCVVDGEAVVVLNRQHPPEVHLAIVAAALRDLPVDEIYLRPAVREGLEELWRTSADGAWAGEVDDIG